MTNLTACVWYKLECSRHGDCYVAIRKGSAPEAPCPKCHTLIALQFACFGMTTAELPHFGKMLAPDAGWREVQQSRRDLLTT